MTSPWIERPPTEARAFRARGEAQKPLRIRLLVILEPTDYSPRETVAEFVLDDRR